MGIILENALLVDFDPIGVEEGSIRMDGGLITARGKNVVRQPGDETIDCEGCVVMPGMVNGHTHLYSALAAGMPPIPKNPTNFHEVLKYIWWRLDRALDPDSIRFSGAVGALEALRSGTTTLIDHHASPDCIDGSLDMMEDGVLSVGPRLVNCYEVTDRNGRAGRDAGLAENRRYLAKCRDRKDGRAAALVGAHASFTCDPETMQALAEISREFQRGVHIHVAEDPCDDVLTRQYYGVGLVERLEKYDLFKTDNVFAHCTHLAQAGIDKANAAGMHVGHNTRSNMNNAVGYAPIGKLKCPVQLGTDGIGADMFSEAKTAWFKSSEAGAGISPNDVVAMLANSARCASGLLGVTLGKLQPGAAADMIITDYRPATPLHSGNFAGHLVYVLGVHHVKDVVIAGQWAMYNRAIVQCDEAEVRAKARPVAAALWERMGRIPC